MEFMKGDVREEVARRDERATYLLKKSFDTGRTVLAFRRKRASLVDKRREVLAMERELREMEVAVDQAGMELEDLEEVVEAKEDHMVRAVADLAECQVVVERTWPRGSAGYSIVRYKDGHVEILPPRENPRSPLPPLWLDNDIPVEMI